MKQRCLLVAVLASVLAACSSPVPTNEPPTTTAVIADASVPVATADASVPLGRINVSAPLGTAPGLCGEATEFAYVAVTTLRDLGFDDQKDDRDYNRLGQFWVTAQKLAIPMPLGLPNVLNRIPGSKRPMPMHLPDRQPARMMCVEWADGNAIGMETLALPDGWAPPSN